MGQMLYSCLVNIQYIYNKEGRIKGTSPMKYVVITDNTNSELVSLKIHQGLIVNYNNYESSRKGIIVSIHQRKWIPKDEYDKLVDRTNISNQALKELFLLKKKI